MITPNEKEHDKINVTILQIITPNEKENVVNQPDDGNNFIIQPVIILSITTFSIIIQPDYI